MMLPNLISVSVMPGCWAEAADHAARDSDTARKTARKSVEADLLDRIMRHPPRRSADYMLFVFRRSLKQPRGTGLALSCWARHASRSTQVAVAKSGHRRFRGRTTCWSGQGRKARFIR